MVHEATSGAGRRRRRALQTDRILDTAMRIVSAAGLEALTVHRLAHDLGYTVGALYRYFDSKDAILVAIQARAIAALADSFADALAVAEIGAPRSPRVRSLFRILVAGTTYRRFATTAPAQFRLLSRMLGDPRELVSVRHGARSLAVAGPLLDRMRTLFADAEAAGALAPGDALQRTVVHVASVHGVLQLEKLQRFAPDVFVVDTLLDDLQRTHLRGWGAPPRSLEAALEHLRTRMATTHDSSAVAVAGGDR